MIDNSSIYNKNYNKLGLLNGVFIRSDQFKWLIGTDKKTNILAQLDELSKSFSSFENHKRNMIRYTVSKVIQIEINKSEIYETY